MAELLESARLLLAGTGQTTITTAGAAPEKRIVKTYKITNYSTSSVDVSVWFGPAASLTDAHAMVKSFTLGGAASSGKTGESLTQDEGEIHILNSTESMVVQASAASVIAVQAEYLRRTTEP
jgi:hypothetical protein